MGHDPRWCHDRYFTGLEWDAGRWQSPFAILWFSMTVICRYLQGWSFTIQMLSIEYTATLIPLASCHDSILSRHSRILRGLKQQPANIKAGGLLDEVNISGQTLRRTFNHYWTAKWPTSSLIFHDFPTKISISLRCKTPSLSWEFLIGSYR